MVPTTVQSTDRPTRTAVVRGLRAASIAGLWGGVVAHLAGVLPAAPPERFDGLVVAVAVVVTIAALHGSIAYEAMRLGRAVEREIQRRRKG